MEKFAILIETWEGIKLKRDSSHFAKTFDSWEEANDFASGKFNCWSIITIKEKKIGVNGSAFMATKIS